MDFGAHPFIREPLKQTKLHRYRKNNIHHLVEIQSYISFALRIILLHFHSHNLDHGACLYEVVQIQSTDVV